MPKFTKNKRLCFGQDNGYEDSTVAVYDASFCLSVLDANGEEISEVQEFCTDTMECILQDGTVVIAHDYGFYPVNVAAQRRLLVRLPPELRVRVRGGREGVVIFRGEPKIPMDAECVDFCAVLNTIPGISTLSSCCGHGKESYYILFKAENVAALYLIAMALECIYDGPPGWTCEPVGSPYYYNKVTFRLSSGLNLGSAAYQQAQTLTASLRDMVALSPVWVNATLLSKKDSNT